MSKNETKIALKEILVSLIAKGTVALAKLIKSKLLPKAEEKYCKVLQAVTEKITNRTAERIAVCDSFRGRCQRIDGFGVCEKTQAEVRKLRPVRDQTAP